VKLQIEPDILPSSV
jgi:hypothetical protein